MAVFAGVAFTWLGMVLGISFLEAPLKFRAPDVTLRIGLGIGRLVFRALNVVEAVFAVVLAVTVAVADVPAPVVVPGAIAVVVLVVQLAAVRPVLRPGARRRGRPALARPPGLCGGRGGEGRRADRGRCRGALSAPFARRVTCRGGSRPPRQSRVTPSGRSRRSTYRVYRR